MMKLKSWTEDELGNLVDDWGGGGGGLNWILAANNSLVGPIPTTARNLEHESILRQFKESSLFSQPKPPRIEKICLIKTNTTDPNSDSVILCNDQIYKLISSNNNEQPEEPEVAEIPSYALDHMYAKKPKEPGTEPPKPVRKRPKKREVVKNQYIVQEMVQEEPPRINIIRQPLPGGGGYKPVGRPKILHTRSPIGSASNTAKEPKWKRTKPTTSSHTRKPKIKAEPIPPTVFEESELPQLGAFVTVCDSDYRDVDVKYEPQLSTTHEFDTNYLPPGYVELSISTEDLEGNGLGDGDGAEAELFLDTMFPMEEVEEALNADMDFCEINLCDALAGDIPSSGSRFIHATVKALSSSKMHRKSTEIRESLSSDFDCLDDNFEDSVQHYHRISSTSLGPRNKHGQIILDEDESLSEFMNEDFNINTNIRNEKISPSTSPSRRSNRTLKIPTKLLDDTDFMYNNNDKRKNKSKPSCS